MNFRRLCIAGLAGLGLGLLSGCYYPPPPTYAYPATACAPGGAPPVAGDSSQGAAPAAPNCYAYPAPAYGYYPYPYYGYYPYYAPYYPPVAVGIGFGFRGHFH